MPELPAGTVAFLFTDVEGSTRLLQEHARVYPRAIARHHELLARAVTDHGGVVFETIGDAVYAAFTRTEAAARAAVAGQRTLLAEDWGELGALRVRMGIHTGDVEVRGSHYFGPALYRCARLMAAAHGGQILASEVAAGILRDAAPDEIGLRDLGEHRLKDLQRGERIFQLLASGLAVDFPAPRTLDARPHNLPLLATATVGRTRELAETRALLVDPATRVLTFTGPGGTGKTRLALALAAEVVEQFADGAFFVPLAPIAAPEFLVPAIASALGVRETQGRPLAGAVADYLRERRLLLLLDNFEHLLEAAPRIAEMVGAAPEVTALVTSQSPLRLYGEREYRVPPLSLGNGAATDPERNDAVRLFLERCREIRSDFGMAPEDAAVALQICRRLDGLPLAIELAAARTRVLAPRAVLERLDHRLELLTSGPRDAPQRQRTLRATLEWSHDLLDDAERRVFRELAVFSGGCDLVAAERVLGADGTAVLDGLESLAAKSLLDTDGERFSMLETIREFAREQLDRHGETDALRRRHAEHYAELAQEAEPHLRSAAQLEWASKLDADRENLRAALAWSLENDPALALRLAHGLTDYWFIRGQIGEGRRWVEAVLDAGADGDDRRRAWVAGYAAFYAGEQGDTATALRRSAEAVAAARRAGDDLTLVVTLCVAALHGGLVTQSEALIAEASKIAEASADPWAIGFAATFEGERRRLRGDEAGALAAYERALEGVRASGDRAAIAINAINAGHMYLRRGDAARAQDLMLESLRLSDELNDPWAFAYTLNGLAGVLAARGKYAAVATVLGWVDAWFRRVGGVLAATDRVDRDRAAAAARAALGDAEFENAWRDGAALSRDAAVAIATRRDD